MKTLAIILVSYLAMLTAEPVAYQVYTLTQTHSCCGAHCCNTSKNCSENQPATCNSCTGCSICLGSFINEPAYKMQPLAEGRVYGTTVNKTLVSNYCSNCFRPPEIV